MLRPLKCCWVALVFITAIGVALNIWALRWTGQTQSGSSHHRTSSGRKLAVGFKGRLGNLMFQYASLFGIAQKNRRLALLSKNSEIASVFSPTAFLSNSAQPGSSFTPKSEVKAGAFEKGFFNITDSSDVILNGYLQSWRYFDHVTHDLRRQFVFRPDIVMNASMELSRAAGEIGRGGLNRTFIGVHVRRGDIAKEKRFISYGYVTADKDYIDRAMSYYRHKYGPVVFVVASDDMEWCLTNVTADDVYFLADDHTPYLAMATLSLCNHTIMTLGSFGWWAGWLAGGEVVYYKNNPRPGSKLDAVFVTQDYVYPHWVEM